MVIIIDNVKKKKFFRYAFWTEVIGHDRSTEFSQRGYPLLQEIGILTMRDFEFQGKNLNMCLLTQ